MVLIGPSASGLEYLQISAIAGNTISVTRGFGSTTPNSFAAGQSIEVLSDSALEGADVSGDISKPRLRKTNYMEIFKKDIIISGSMLAVTQLGGIADELLHQQEMRTREILRDLEKASIRGILSGNTLGSASAYRTMKGMRSFMATNAKSIGTLTESWLGNLLQDIWDKGAGDIDILASGVTDKRIIDSWNNTRVNVAANDDRFRNLISYYESAFGVQAVMLNRWVPAAETLAVASRRVKLVPLKTRSAHYEAVSKTGDSVKGMVIGEYALEFKNEDGMGRKY